MCGIIGVTGEPDALALILTALHQLEYRGYDSAGVALVADGADLACPGGRRHAVGGRSGQADRGRAPPAHARAGIGPHPLGHPRAPDRRRTPTPTSTARAAWPSSTTGSSRTTPSRAPNWWPTATRYLGHRHRGGGPSHRGSHDGRAAAHRGHQGGAPRSCGAPSPSPSVHADEPDTIVAARRSTPLILGLRDGVALLASDIPALLGHGPPVLALGDDELAVLTPGTITVTTLAGDPVIPEEFHITWDLEAAQQGRLRGLHVQGDARAAPGGGQHAAGPPRRRRPPGARRDAARAPTSSAR